MARISKSPQERKSELLQAAVDLFMVKGYEATSVGDIVGKVGVAQGLFYYYFKSKEEIYHAALEYYTDAYAAIIQKTILDRSVPLMQRTQKILYGMGAMFDEPETTLMDELHQSNRKDLHDRLTLRMAQTLIDPLGTILTEYNERGLTQIANTEYAATFIVFGVFGIMYGTHDLLPDVVLPQYDDVISLIASTLNISTETLMKL